jgi:pSer/pThr/pTyr-binding forkhead associated (FHA) protein
MEIVLLILRLLLALALYAFLGWALWLLWRDLRSQPQRPSAAAAPLTLTLAGDEAAPAMRFTRPEVLIGRQPDCDCRLDDKTISARHARLSFHHGQWWVEDLNSKNGTFLNQQRLSEPLVLASGDELRCGQVLLQIHIGASLAELPAAGQEKNL